MTRHETAIQYAKIVLLGAILVLAVWSFGNHQPKVEAQLAAASGFQSNHITTAVNTLVATSGVTFHTLTINGGTPGAISVFDASTAGCTGGTTLAIVATLTGSSAVSLHYDLQTKTGLCITTAAASDVTVTYR